jgi:hypothetical protein
MKMKWDKNISEDDNIAAYARRMVRNALRGATSLHVVVSPIRRPDPNGFVFLLVTYGTKGTQVDRIIGMEREDRYNIRDKVIAELEANKDLTVHVTDNVFATACQPLAG